MRIVRERCAPIARVAWDVGIYEGTLGNWVVQGCVSWRTAASGGVGASPS